MPQAPRPAHRPTTRSHHGDDVSDPYEWLRNSDDPEVMAHLTAENAYTDAVTERLAPLREEIFCEIKAHTQETDLSVPVKEGDWWYLRRTTKGEQYPTFSRVPYGEGELPTLVLGDLLPGEQIILDCPALAKGQEFFSLGAATTSPDQKRLAYATDVAGDERFGVVVCDLETGEVLDDALAGVGYGLAFSVDGEWLYYARVDDAWRQYQLWRHRIGGPETDDELLIEESDQKFSLYFGTSRDQNHLVSIAHSTTTSECAVLDLTDPNATPVVVAPRQSGLEYSVEVADDHLLIVHNAHTEGFELAVAPMGQSTPDQWRTLMAAGEGERLESADYFDKAIAVSLRSGGLAGVRVIPRGPEGWDASRAWQIGSGGELDTVSLGDNRCVDATSLRYDITSLLIPQTVCEVDLDTQQSRVLRETPVPGYDRAAYTERRLWVRAEDGTQIPVSLVARADVTPDGTNPGLLYGYGSYEVSVDPQFAATRLPLLDRGVVFAIAHIRGGGEMGRAWYEQGRLTNKKNSFTDFVDVGRELVRSGWVAPDRLAAEGGSAGGLLMGAATNLAPDLFRAVHAAVPFVDALTTVLDPSLPLTVGEWEEWGDPLHDADVYAYMKSYSPYENIRAVDYPAILASTSLNDTRVFFVEPTKWVARLRETVTSDQNERPILFRCQLVAGHGGRSGRYDKWRQRAEELAFLLDQIGAA